MLVNKTECLHKEKKMTTKRIRKTQWEIKEQLLFADEHSRLYRALRKEPKTAVVAIGETTKSVPDFYVMSAELFNSLTGGNTDD